MLGSFIAIRMLLGEEDGVTMTNIMGTLLQSKQNIQNKHVDQSVTGRASREPAGLNYIIYHMKPNKEMNK